MDTKTLTKNWLTKLQRYPLLNLVLVLATLATTTWAGAAHQGVSLWKNPEAWRLGLPYGFAIMLILGVHEMGHYLAARYHGVRVSLPYFIPIPFSLGTLGAFIRMAEDPRERRKLFDIAVAGPVAGLVAALGVLALASHSAMTDVGQSLAFAGRLGLMLTAFNLLPVGQLDGGHMARALFGRPVSVWIGRIALGVMVILGVFAWHGFPLWALMAFAMGGAGSADTTDASSPEERGFLRDMKRQAFGAAAFALVLVMVLPVAGIASSLGAASCPWR